MCVNTPLPLRIHTACDDVPYREGSVIDLLRKFFLTALPRLIGAQGSASQRIVVLSVSTGFLALQIHWQPYQHPRSNALKTAVDANIFLFIAVAQWLRSEQLTGYGDIHTQSTVTGLLAVFTAAVFVGGESGGLRYPL